MVQKEFNNNVTLHKIKTFAVSALMLVANTGYALANDIFSAGDAEGLFNLFATWYADFGWVISFFALAVALIFTGKVQEVARKVCFGTAIAWVLFKNPAIYKGTLDTLSELFSGGSQ